jgi:surface antigen Omp85-like protein
VWPTRRLFMLRGGIDVTRWSLKDPIGRAPAIQSVYTPATLPGVGTESTFRHAEATVGIDTRLSDGYARRGGFYGVTAHDYTDNDTRFGFRQIDYEAIQHIPILRESWVISLRGLASTTSHKDGQEIPFFALPSLGGGSNLRGFQSWRFRDQNSLLLQAEWRIMVNRFFDTALFYDGGKVAARTEDLDFNGLRNDYGFGARFHTPFATVFRIDVARSREGTRLVFATSPVF